MNSKPNEISFNKKLSLLKKHNDHKQHITNKNCYKQINKTPNYYLKLETSKNTSEQKMINTKEFMRNQHNKMSH